MGADKVQLAKQGIEAYGAGDWERFKAPLASDAVYEELSTQRRVQGPDAIVELSKGWRKAFPDSKGTITRVVEGPDAVVLEITWEGTHSGELASQMGPIPATYKRVKLPAPRQRRRERAWAGAAVRKPDFGLFIGLKGAYNSE